MNKIAERLYEKFTVTERVNLTIAALARSDNEEIDKLARTCPRYTYTGMDMRYSGALDDLSQVCMQLAVLLQYFHARISYSELLICHYALLEETPQHNLQEVRTQFISIFKAIYQAFLEFCTEVKLEAQDVLQWIDLPSLLDEFEDYLDDSIAINQEWFTMTKKIFMDGWQR